MHKVFFEIYKNIPRQGPGNCESTQKAFSMIPKIDKPKILDIGCGSGLHTVDLANVTNGNIISIDKYTMFLDLMKKNVTTADLQNRIEIKEGDMFDLQFEVNEFDIIWAEGSIFIIGFEKGINDWKQYLKPSGYMVISELVWTDKNPPQEAFEFWNGEYPGLVHFEENIKMIENNGYECIEHFKLPDSAWRKNHYDDIEIQIAPKRKENKNDNKALETLDMIEKEIECFRKYSESLGYMFFVISKI